MKKADLNFHVYISDDRSLQTRNKVETIYQRQTIPLTDMPERRYPK